MALCNADASETERRAQAELQRHLSALVPSGRKIWLSEKLEEADFRGVDRNLPQVWGLREPLRSGPGDTRSPVADLSVDQTQ